MSEDEKLLARIRQDDDLAWGEIIKAFSKPLQSFLRTLSCKDADFDDVFQETLIRLDANCKTLVLHSSLKTYLFKIAKNVWFEIIRKRKKNGNFTVDENHVFEKFLVDDDIEANHFEAFYDPNEDYLSIIEQLNDSIKKVRMSNCADIFHMKFWLNLPISIIAEELNLTYNSAKAKLNTCKNALKDILIEAGIKFPDTQNSKEDE